MTFIDQRPDDSMADAFATVDRSAIATVDAAPFREAMARLGAAVQVVTTAGPAGKTGFTATAVCSVSDQPPTLLVCLHHRSQATEMLRENQVLCVNTLSAACEDVADVFAGRGPETRAERLTRDEWMTLKTGAPVLRSAVAAFDCRIVEVRTVATHHVIFAVVQALHVGPPGLALVYHERAYKQV